MSFFGFPAAPAPTAAPSAIKIDPFSASLRGQRILSQRDDPRAVPPLLDYVQNLREPFYKMYHVSALSAGLAPPSILLPYSISYHVRDGTDWSFFLSNLVHCAKTKPVLVVIEGVEVPAAVWQKMPVANVTVIHLAQFAPAAAPSITPAVPTVPARTLTPYNTVFFPILEQVVPAAAEAIQTQLRTIGHTLTTKELTDILHELRVAKAGLVWCGADNSLYWYDAADTYGQMGTIVGVDAVADAITGLAAILRTMKTPSYK